MNTESLYIHFPFCEHLCNYCDFYKKKLKIESFSTDIEKYHHYLDLCKMEQAKLLDEWGVTRGELKTLFIGGGTPSLWGLHGIDWLSKQKFKFKTNYEWTMEANPHSFTKELAIEYSNIGVNRWSLGAQTLNKEMLPLLDRVHNPKQVLQSLEILAKLPNSPGISVDIMLGIPSHSPKYRNVIQELKILLEFPINHLSVYILTTKKNYINESLKPHEDFIQKEYLEVCDFLKDHDFEHYEVSNFAKKSGQSLHNLAYWNHQSVMALGPSATGLVHGEKGSLRYKWLADWDQTPQLDLERLTPEQVLLEKLYLGLRLSQGIEIKDFIHNNHKKLIDPLLDSWHHLGWISNKSPCIPTSRGFLMMDSMISELLKFL